MSWSTYAWSIIAGELAESIGYNSYEPVLNAPVVAFRSYLSFRILNNSSMNIMRLKPIIIATPIVVAIS